MTEHIERLKTFQALALPEGIGRDVHQNRLLKIAREGGQMTSRDLSKFERMRRYATLVALVLEGIATVTDEVVDLHDRILVIYENAPRRFFTLSQEKNKATRYLYSVFRDQSGVQLLNRTLLGSILCHLK
jgi:hypothetical protein